MTSKLAWVAAARLPLLGTLGSGLLACRLLVAGPLEALSYAVSPVHAATSQYRIHLAMNALRAYLRVCVLVRLPQLADLQATVRSQHGRSSCSRVGGLVMDCCVLAREASHRRANQVVAALGALVDAFLCFSLPKELVEGMPMLLACRTARGAHFCSHSSMQGSPGRCRVGRGQLLEGDACSSLERCGPQQRLSPPPVASHFATTRKMPHQEYDHRCRRRLWPEPRRSILAPC